MKYYFSDIDDNERCYTIQYYLDWMRENDVKEMDVFEAEIEIGTSYFYCREYGEVGEVGETCGKWCDKYSPRNGKSGRCRHSANCYEKTDIKKHLILKP